MLDLHAHILPGIDDGPGTIEQSLELARAAVADGTVRIAATPHLRSDHPGVIPAELAERRDQLEGALRTAGVELEVVGGGELDLSWAQSASDDELDLVSYGAAGRDLLVETPYGPLPGLFEEMLFALRSRGYRLTLAHPERNPSLQGNPERLRDLVRQGHLIQLTSASLSGTSRRSATRRFAGAAIDAGLAHLLASDAHGSATIDRAPLAAGMAAAARIDRARAEWMVTEAPAAVLAGEPLPDVARDQPRPRRLLGGRRFRR